ncbi:MAG: hypothetical protein HY905_09510 [Deltaproteobacteria bacterium]|nr:hypothetical protein [Deltaproteobacteria bacterium]
MATGRGWRRADVLVVTLVAVWAALGCRVGQEGDQATAKIHARNQELARELDTLRMENDGLRAQLLGYQPWEGTIQLQRVGGPYGIVPFVRACPRGEAVMGFAGRSGGVIDAVAPLCAPLDRSALRGLTGATTVETELRLAGGNGGGAFRTACAPGSYVVGVRGRAGGAIDALEPLCEDTSLADASAAPLGEAVPRTRPVATLAKVGGSGGAPFESRCPAGWVVVGVSGRIGDFVQSLAVQCGRLPMGGVMER